MDRNNLGALTEEEDEESWDGSIQSDNETEGDDLQKDEPNKFESLCDGVLNSLALVHASQQEILELKDELLKHSLPPNVLAKLVLTVTKGFRSISDLHMPVNELIRMVRLYSTPWEQKSTALKKLHEDYEGKKTQLNIAIKRLQLVDAHSKRMAKDKRVMNWEKLYAKMTSAKGHGRRWKFLIETFKSKAKLGTDHLQDYLNSMDQSESDAEDDIETAMNTTMLQGPSPSEPETLEKDEETEDEDEEESSGQGRESVQESEESSVRPPAFIKPPMKDKNTWTHEPEYDRFLQVRVFKPEGVDHRELKCSLTFKNQRFKTEIFDPLVELEEEKEEETKTESNEEASESSKKSEKGPPKKGRGRGLIGTRGGADNAPLLPTDNQKTKKEKDIKFESFVFTMPEQQYARGLYNPEAKQGNEVDQFKITVYHGQKENMIAMATIDMDDFVSLDLPIDVQSPDLGDEFDETAASQSSVPKVAPKPQKIPFAEMEPINFPLYPVKGGSGSSQNTPSGTLPLVCFWIHKVKARTQSKFTESESLRDIVMEKLGIDLETTTKDDLNKEMIDEALSTICFTPEVVEETVLKADYDKLATDHREELSLLQQEYEQRLQYLASSMEEMQASHYAEMEAATSAQTRAPEVHVRTPTPPTKPMERPASVRIKSASERQGSAHSQISQVTIEVPKQPSQSQPPSAPAMVRMPTNESMKGKQQRNFMVGKPLPNWGEDLPKNFFERLKLFEEESQRHKDELNIKTTEERQQLIEKQLAAQYRSTGKPKDGEEIYDPMQDVSLPAVFMPTRSHNVNIYNPRAHNYYHPTGSSGARLTQPPSMVQLPPLPKSKVSVVNLFDLSQNFHRGGPDWLMQRYLQQAQKTDATPLTPGYPYSGTEENPVYAEEDTQEIGESNSILSNERSKPPSRKATEAEC